jgi:hypothetical protein
MGRLGDGEMGRWGEEENGRLNDLILTIYKKADVIFQQRIGRYCY